MSMCIYGYLRESIRHGRMLQQFARLYSFMSVTNECILHEREHPIEWSSIGKTIHLVQNVTSTILS